MNTADIKTHDEIAKMRLGGRIASRILNYLSKNIKAGMSTSQIDKIAEDMILNESGKPSFKGYHNYPNAICISVNDEVVHGIPKNRVIDDGDIVGLDIGVFFKGFHTDTAITVPVGKVSNRAKELIKITKKSMFRGIDKCRVGNRLGDVQSEIQKTIEKAGFSVVKDLVGHGVGRKLQEYPPIPNYGKPNTGIQLKEGMTLAIEPMVNAGGWQVKVLDDGWTVVTVDNSLSAHFEHTVAITKNGPIMLTK